MDLTLQSSSGGSGPQKHLLSGSQRVMALCQGEDQKGTFVPPWIWREVNTDWRQVIWKGLSLLFSILQDGNCPYFVCVALVPGRFDCLTLSSQQWPGTGKQFRYFSRLYHVNILPASIPMPLLQISWACRAKINYVREQLIGIIDGWFCMFCSYKYHQIANIYTKDSYLL